MHVSENTYGQFFLVFDNEADMFDFWLDNPEFHGLPWACHGGYMNAIELCEPNR